MPEEGSDEVPEEVSEENPEEVSEEIPGDIPAEVPAEASEEIPEENPEEVPEVTPEEVPEETPEEASEEMPDENPEEVPEETPEEAPAETPEEAPEAMPEETPEEVSAGEAPEGENTEEAPEIPAEVLCVETEGEILNAASAPEEETPALQAEAPAEEANQVLEAAAPAEETPALETAADSNYQVTYDYNAGLYDPASGNYIGVYSTQLNPNENAGATIGMPSIADANLDTPTTEAPAIIQGAATGYENRLGPVNYEVIKERVDPYTDYKVTLMDEQGQDGTVHQKPTGFDGTYVITRLDVGELFDKSMDLTNQYLHMKMEKNMAIIPGAGMMDNDKAFADATGQKTGAYLYSDLLDKNGGDRPFIDVILFSTGKLAAGADTGKTDAPNGDVPIQFYLDNIGDYNPSLKYDPASTDPNHAAAVLAKFFDANKAAAGKTSSYLLKGSDLALEVAVENSGGAQKDTGTTYWSFKKAMEDPYYDQEKDLSPADLNCGRTVKLISEVPVTEEISLQGADENHLKKRTLDVNSFDIQVANNTTTDPETYSDGFVMKNAWLTLSDKSNTTGAEMAIGNNAKFTIDAGAKLIIDETCQLEIEWDGATTTPSEGGSASQPADVLNNGLLNILAGGEVVNNGVITIEGFEGKPLQPGEQQPVETEKGCGEMTISEGATLTNNGSFVVYGILYNLGRLVNNGKYNDLLISNDPDKGQTAYHKGVTIAWKDDVTQPNVKPGTLYNGMDKNGQKALTAMLVNNGDIVLAPGQMENHALLVNNGDISEVAVTEAVIPITADPSTPTIVTKRIQLPQPEGSKITNLGTIVNKGYILPANVVINDNGSLGALSKLNGLKDMFVLDNTQGTIDNQGYIYGWPYPERYQAAEKELSIQLADGTWLYLYFSNNSFKMVFRDGKELTGTFGFNGDALVFIFTDGTLAKPGISSQGVSEYDFTMKDGYPVKFSLDAAFVNRVRDTMNEMAVKAAR